MGIGRSGELALLVVCVDHDHTRSTIYLHSPKHGLPPARELYLTVPKDILCAPPAHAAALKSVAEQKESRRATKAAGRPGLPRLEARATGEPLSVGGLGPGGGASWPKRSVASRRRL